LSNTTFIWEPDRSEGMLRVTLTMDSTEVEALRDVALATFDASVTLPDHIDEITAHNALQLYRWAARTAAALDALTFNSSAEE
jgi:hypothetical protein